MNVGIFPGRIDPRTNVAHAYLKAFRVGRRCARPGGGGGGGDGGGGGGCRVDGSRWVDARSVAIRRATVRCGLFGVDAVIADRVDAAVLAAVAPELCGVFPRGKDPPDGVHAVVSVG